MGCGKSSLGRLLSNRLGIAFFDNDEEISRLRGKSIPQIFAEDGEATFREAEREMVLHLTSQSCDSVIALGGGAFVDATVREECLRSGMVFWLDAPPCYLASRVGAAKSRPLLSESKDKIATLTQLLEERSVFYSEADHRIDVSACSDEEVVSCLASLWQEQQLRDGDSE
ncbi:MAG: shikimate kinase [Alphaproteobacteria bacterium]